MSLRPRQRTMVWTSSAGWVDRPAARRPGRPWRMRRLRRWLRVGALLAVIGLIRLAGIARTRWRRILLLAGGAVTVAGISLPSEAVLLSGMLVLLAVVLSPSGREVTDSEYRIGVALVHRR